MCRKLAYSTRRTPRTSNKPIPNTRSVNQRHGLYAGYSRSKYRSGCDMSCTCCGSTIDTRMMSLTARLQMKIFVTVRIFLMRRIVTSTHMLLSKETISQVEMKATNIACPVGRGILIPVNVHITQAFRVLRPLRVTMLFTCNR